MPTTWLGVENKPGRFKTDRMDWSLTENLTPAETVDTELMVPDGPTSGGGTQWTEVTYN